LLCHLGLALTAALAGAGPSAAQSPAPAITVDTVPAAGEADTGDAPAAKPAAAAPATTKKKGGEVLPWANKALTPVAAATGGDPAAAEAAATQCGGVFEAACRDLKACAWIADVALENGTIVPARCVARPPAPPKSAKKVSNPPKKTAKAPVAETPEGPATTPKAVKASLTHTEDEKPSAAPEAATTQAAAAARSEPEAPAPAHKEAAHEEAPHESAAQEAAAPSPQAEAPAPDDKATPSAAGSKPQEQAENVEESVEAKTPIVVRPPPESEAASVPSFSAASPIIPGADAIVVTVPPPGE